MADSQEQKEQNCEQNERENGCNQEENALCDCTLAKENLLRLTADFQNFKKRVEKDREQWSSSAQSDVLLMFLPIVDDFERALAEAKKNEQIADFAQWIAGFELIYKSLQAALEKMGVTPIKELSHFNPELHEALVQVSSETHQEGEVVQVLQQGFMFKGKVLRPSKVSVAQ